MNNLNQNLLYKKYFSKELINKYTITYIETDFNEKFIELQTNNINILIDYKIICSFDLTLNKILLSKDMIIIPQRQIYNKNLDILKNLNKKELEKVLLEKFKNRIIYDTINNLRIYYTVEKIIRI